MRLGLSLGCLLIGFVLGIFLGPMVLRVTGFGRIGA